MIPFELDKVSPWLYVVGAVAIALCANLIAASWAKSDEKFSFLLLLLVIVSPFVFITFGLVTARVGVAIGSGTIDALLTVSTVAFGLLLFQEWDNLSFYQYLGLLCVLAGIVLLQFAPKGG
jgi:multidrug transporter EmrE-like cation transporter